MEILYITVLLIGNKLTTFQLCWVYSWIKRVKYKYMNIPFPAHKLHISALAIGEVFHNRDMTKVIVTT
jgi:hypothetical protein